MSTGVPRSARAAVVNRKRGCDQFRPPSVDSETHTSPRPRQRLPDGARVRGAQPVLPRHQWPVGPVSFVAAQDPGAAVGLAHARD